MNCLSLWKTRSLKSQSIHGGAWSLVSLRTLTSASNFTGALSAASVPVVGTLRHRLPRCVFASLHIPWPIIILWSKQLFWLREGRLYELYRLNRDQFLRQGLFSRNLNDLTGCEIHAPSLKDAFARDYRSKNEWCRDRFSLIKALFVRTFKGDRPPRHPRSHNRPLRIFCGKYTSEVLAP